MLDFPQKSSGTAAMFKAMEGCDCERAIVFGMPCCKKWCFYRPEQPLYYQDDNGPCYVYSYADQMVADAWLALADSDRSRFAPCFAAFDPTDLGALSHVQRMYEKYPKIGGARGIAIGEELRSTSTVVGIHIVCCVASRLSMCVSVWVCRRKAYTGPVGSPTRNSSQRQTQSESHVSCHCRVRRYVSTHNRAQSEHGYCSHRYYTVTAIQTTHNHAHTINTVLASLVSQCLKRKIDLATS